MFECPTYKTKFMSAINHYNKIFSYSVPLTILSTGSEWTMRTKIRSNWTEEKSLHADIVRRFHFSSKPLISGWKHYNILNKRPSIPPGTIGPQRHYVSHDQTELGMRLTTFSVFHVILVFIPWYFGLHLLQQPQAGEKNLGLKINQCATFSYQGCFRKRPHRSIDGI